MTSHKVKDENDTVRSTLAQIIATLAFSLISVNVGLVLEMPVIVIGALRGEDSPMGLSESQASWFGSFIYIIQPIGSVLSAFLQETLGRKRCLMLINVPMFAGWIILYFSTARVHLFIAATLMAMAIGFMEAPILSYIGEITQPRLRGVLSAFGGVFCNIGFMTESFLGAGLPWRTMVLYSIPFPVAAFIAMGLIPDSPAWLVTKGRVRDAEKAYQWLRGWVKQENVKEELDAMVTYVKLTHKIKGVSSEEQTPLPTKGVKVKESVDGKYMNVWNKMTEPGVLTALRIIFIYFFVSACTSLTAMRPFFIEILDSLNLPLKPHTIVAICGCVQMAGAISMGLLVKPLGKRGLTFLSLGASVICCLGLAVYLLVGLRYSWLPVILFCFSYYFGSLGILAMPWVLIIELFPLR